jgi:ubiquinone/menaquinone biosynthesis C-methylase UbiE
MEFKPTVEPAPEKYPAKRHIFVTTLSYPIISVTPSGFRAVFAGPRGAFWNYSQVSNRKKLPAYSPHAHADQTTLIRRSINRNCAVNQPITEVAKALQTAYDERYSDESAEWRELCGKYKAENIIKVCGNNRFTKVLECGAGEGSILKHLDESGVFPELHAIEISDTGVTQIEKRNLARLKSAKKFDGYEIPYSDKEFDLVYCSHVIEHVEHPRLLLREIKRVSHFQVFEIPLDYSIGVDRKFEHYLSFGHINIYTPSLFKFLINSEGFEILNELLTHTNNEVTRFNWYRNMNLEKTAKRELALHLQPLRNLLRRIKRGKDGYKEYGYYAYTCFTKGGGELKIF